jgi:hypothetical protein
VRVGHLRLGVRRNSRLSMTALSIVLMSAVAVVGIVSEQVAAGVAGPEPGRLTLATFESPLKPTMSTPL